jgi:hypothetical protein
MYISIATQHIPFLHLIGTPINVHDATVGFLYQQGNRYTRSQLDKWYPKGAVNQLQALQRQCRTGNDSNAPRFIAV